MTRIVAWWYTLPLPARSAIVDAVESGAAAALGIQFVIPPTLAGWPQVFATIGSAFAGAVISNLRRRAQRAIAARQAAA